jgi:hypothetical protein
MKYITVLIPSEASKTRRVEGESHDLVSRAVVLDFQAPITARSATTLRSTPPPCLDFEEGMKTPKKLRKTRKTQKDEVLASPTP